VLFLDPHSDHEQYQHQTSEVAGILEELRNKNSREKIFPHYSITHNHMQMVEQYSIITIYIYIYFFFYFFLRGTGGIFLWASQGVWREMPVSATRAWQKHTGAQLEILPKPNNVFQPTVPTVPSSPQ